MKTLSYPTRQPLFFSLLQLVKVLAIGVVGVVLLLVQAAMSGA